MASTEKNNIDEMTDYICENVDDLALADRKELLSRILESAIDPKKVRVKEGNGTQIMIRDIPVEIIPVLHTFMRKKLHNYEISASS